MTSNHRHFSSHPLLAVVALISIAIVVSNACSKSHQTAFAEQALAEADPLLPAEAMKPDIFYEQNIRVTWPEGSQRFQAVLQKVDQELSIVAMNPAGQPAFRISLKDGEVSQEYFIDRRLPFPPEFIVSDVQKAFYPWFPSLEGERPSDRETQKLGMHIEERYDDGRLHERIFSYPNVPEREPTVVSYDWDVDGDVPRVTVDNVRFGYSIDVETVSSRLL
jgi:hypothetical protein